MCWDDLRWYTKFTSCLRLNSTYFHSSALEDLSFYHPREFFCSDCGLVEPDIHGRLERVDRALITHCVFLGRRFRIVTVSVYTRFKLCSRIRVLVDACPVTVCLK